MLANALGANFQEDVLQAAILFYNLLLFIMGPCEPHVDGFICLSICFARPLSVHLDWEEFLLFFFFSFFVMS